MLRLVVVVDASVGSEINSNSVPENCFPIEELAD